MNCRACDKQLDDEAVDLGEGVTTCPWCGAVFDHGDRDRPRAFLPDHVKVGDTDGLCITRRWRNAQTAGVFLIAGSAVSWIAPLIYMTALPDTDADAELWVYLGLWTVVVLGLVWFGLTKLVNRTEVSVHRGTLRLRNGPLPWFGKKNVDTDAVDAIYVGGPTAGELRTGRTDYDVRALLGDGRRVELVIDLTTRPQALYVAHLIRERLRTT